MVRYAFILMILLMAFTVHAQEDPNEYSNDVVVGAERLDTYLPQLEGKRVALTANQTSLVDGKHLLDVLLENDVNVVKVFALEHGFRGEADAGARITDGKDERTGVPVVSLYGASKKPSATMLEDVDIVLFDLQDVGARFYTYISSMHYIMEGCAENDRAFMVLDRPNPNGHYVDGPVLDMRWKSFIGMHPVPIVHGMTIGEFAQMINGEKWLQGGANCDLTVITCKAYDHNTFYKVPVKPSPNLPNMASIYMYPSLCLIEGTTLSVGRGTDKPFQIVGAPQLETDFSFTPESRPGARSPKHKGVKCYGYDLQEFGFETMREMRQIYLHWVVSLYKQFPDKDDFFKKSGSFDLLCGSDDVRKMIIAGKTAEEIAATWKDEVEAFNEVRKKYLLYDDFE